MRDAEPHGQLDGEEICTLLGPNIWVARWDPLEGLSWSLVYERTWKLHEPMLGNIAVECNLVPE